MPKRTRPKSSLRAAARGLPAWSRSSLLAPLRRLLERSALRNPRCGPRVLAPAYRKFVLDAPGELERSLGLTLVHLIWLEVCDHVRMALAVADSLSLDAKLNDPDAMIARHLISSPPNARPPNCS